MVDFITEEIPMEGRVTVYPHYMRLHPSSDGMMHDECMVGIGGTSIRWSAAIRNVPDTAKLHDTGSRRDGSHIKTKARSSITIGIVGAVCSSPTPHAAKVIFKSP
jgi:hypothetical protein